MRRLTTTATERRAKAPNYPSVGVAISKIPAISLIQMC